MRLVRPLHEPIVTGTRNTIIAGVMILAALLGLLLTLY
jgi:hypothetical protein